MSRGMQQFLVLSVLSFGLLSCDMARNMESPFDRYFVKFIGRDGDQQGIDMVEAEDKTIYVLGNLSSAGRGQQLFIAHVTAEGNVIWDKTLGGVADDEACDIELLDNDNLAILSTVTDTDRTYRNFTIRLMEPDGTVIDSVSYGRSTNHWNAVSISETTSSYIVTGSTDSVEVSTDPSNAFAVKFNQSDLSIDPSWDNLYGARTDFDGAVKTFEVPSLSLFYIFGYSNLLGTSDNVPDYNTMIWVVSPLGDFKNTIVFLNSSIPGSGLTADERLASVSLIPPSSGVGFLMTGYSTVSAVNEQKLFTMKIRQDLENVNNVVNLATHEIFQIPPRLDNGSASQITLTRASSFSSPGGGFFVLGADEDNIYLKKLDKSLADAWTSPPSFLFGGVGTDLPGSVLETTDGRILVLGTMVLGDVDSQQKILLMKLSPNGRLGE
jgi:hypothetical protein